MGDYESYDWVTPPTSPIAQNKAPKVHSYGAGAAGRGRRDPQLVTDPTVLTFEDEYGSMDHAPYEPRSPVTVNPAFGAVNPTIKGYAGGHPVYADSTETDGTMRESYCICARTDRERRLLFTVIGLAVLCLVLLTALISVLPSMFCKGDQCDDDLNLGDMLPFMSSRLGKMLS